MIPVSCVVYLKYRTCPFILLSKHIGGRDFNCVLNIVLIFNFSFQCKEYREFEFEIRNNTDSMSSLLFFCLLSATILYHDKQKCLSCSTFNCKSQKMEGEVRKSINTPMSLFHIRWCFWSPSKAILCYFFLPNVPLQFIFHMNSIIFFAFSLVYGFSCKSLTQCLYANVIAISFIFTLFFFKKCGLECHGSVTLVPVHRRQRKADAWEFEDSYLIRWYFLQK